MRSRIGRAAVYSLAGFAFEVAFSALHDAARQKPIRFRTSPLMLPVYALLQPLGEPVHDALRDKNVAARGTVYGLGFLTVEYTSGQVMRATRGEAPWDYTYAKYHLHGLIRPEYFFLWAAAGLLFEHLHHALMEG